VPAFRGNSFPHAEQISEFARNGGKVILMESALSLSEGKKAQLSLIKQTPKADSLGVYGNRIRDNASLRIAGSIYRVALDNTHPLAYGYGQETFFLKKNTKLYNNLPKGGNVGTYPKDTYVSGFAGSKVRPLVPGTLAVGVEQLGDGEIIYFTDSPIFRNFWRGTSLLFANAVFFVGNDKER